MTAPGTQPPAEPARGHACQGPELRVARAGSFFGRMRGLIGRPPPAPGTALWIAPCRQVHTFGMAYAIDVLHLDDGGRVLRVQTLEPWRLGAYLWRAAGVLELQAGEAARLGITPGARPRLIVMEARAT